MKTSMNFDINLGDRAYWLNKYILYKTPKDDYHGKRYAKVYDFDPSTTTIKAVSWYDAFIGYQKVTVPMTNVIEVKNKFIGVGIPDEVMQKVIK